MAETPDMPFNKHLGGLMGLGDLHRLLQQPAIHGRIYIGPVSMSGLRSY